ncbi:MAG: CBS domain-containing protein, partial [Deferribacterales bacterium]
MIVFQKPLSGIPGNSSRAGRSFMFVKNWMRREVITISPDETILDAKHIMKENGIRRLPVVENNKLAG